MTISYALLIVIFPFSHTSSDRTERSLMTSSDSVSKIISCCFSCFVSDFSIISMAFAVCIPKKIHSISVFLFLAFILRERVMLLLSAEASFKPCCPFFESSLLTTFLKGSSLAALPLRTKDVDIPYFVQNFLLALLAYMESAATHLTLYIHKLCIRIQSFKRIPSLNALNERCSMNDMPSICILLTFAPNSTDLVCL